MDSSLNDEMKEFCSAIGELILWANFIDVQLNKAIMLMFVIPPHPFIEPIISQLDVRAKAELLKKRAKLISEKGQVWKKGVSKWVENAEKVNSHRNIVAHYHITMDGTEIKLVTTQLSKIFSNFDTSLKPKKAKGLVEIREWIQHATAVVEEGQELLENLQLFADKVGSLAKAK